MSEMNPVTIDAILEAVKRYQPNADTDLIRRAYELADAAHSGQKRISGEDYIIHPLAVAKILTELQIDDITISAAILHDVVEDTTHTLKEMRELFGDEVAMLIDGVTKLLHNMRTLKYVREDKQKRIARETIEIYAPLANRLGISNIKWELEDLCLRYLDPKAYYDLVESVKQKRQERQAFIEEAHEQIVEKIEEAHMTAEIQGRAKHFYSIYKKMKRDQKDISEIYDLSALRVLVNSVKDCYGVLGIIHAMWKPLPGRFKDYIAMPKSNGYQSLHTTVICRGYPLEIQIRTFAMHKVSEYGVAAHWKYKEAGKSVGATHEYDQKMSWLRQMVSLQHELDDPREYFEALKVDVFSDEVFVFTPKGDVVDLPKGSIPIDFAYRIHTEVGHHCVGAKINGKIVPLEYKLKNGDIVSIITNKSNNGPSRDWLNIVASSETRTKIRSWFKKQRKEENIARGMDMMEKEAKHLGYVPKEILKPERLELLAKKLNIPQINDLLASIGYGGITLNGILGKLIEMHKQDLQKATPPDISQMLSELKQPLKNRKKKASHGILVEGEGGFLVRLARCCNPIPGDPITGYITRGRGVSVHRSDCPNLLNDMDFSRVIEVNWDVGLDKVYTVQIEIVCNDKTGMLAELFALPAEMKVNISSLTAKTNKTNRTSIVNMGLDVRNSQQVAQIMTKIRRMKDVYSVSRSLGTSAKDDEL